MVPDAATIRDLFALLSNSGLAFPAVLGAAFRALEILDGTRRLLAPGFDIAAESRAVAGRLAGNQVAPPSLKVAATSELLVLLPLLRRLPGRNDRIGAALAQGGLTANIRLFSDPRRLSVHRACQPGSTCHARRRARADAGRHATQHAGPDIRPGLTALRLIGCIGRFLSVTLTLRIAIEVLSLIADDHHANPAARGFLATDRNPKDITSRRDGK